MWFPEFNIPIKTLITKITLFQQSNPMDATDLIFKPITSLALDNYKEVI